MDFRSLGRFIDAPEEPSVLPPALGPRRRPPEDELPCGQDAGLPSSAIPLALFAFNLGIEIGQVSFVLVLLALGAGVRRLAGPLPPWARRVPAYCMGTVAAYWCFQRAAAWLGA